MERARKLGLDAELYISENNSYHFFKQLDDLIITGPTFTNVMDLRLIIVS
jgi:hydroxypyruvate reductase